MDRKINSDTALSMQQVASDLRFDTFESGRLTINKHTYTESVLIHQNTVVSTFNLTASELSNTHIQDWIKRYSPEFILIGTGSSNKILALNAVDANGLPVAVECMSTTACMRTFVALQCEDRNFLCFLSVL